ncbi:hypothetical protein [Oxalobacter formigenes]|uniref:hypothetical protein n=1 Tax=Oxalobacter formigenes TaxID=847 RepID=UPI000560B2CB|nr:hypothetical protein [Oxalobacter formigenes]ARQ46652.1 hypothetical protein BRW83_1912 [Oxalobacter formigenes]ARQ78726.1 hypothetical protein BRW84_08975 [Oxalobacter formigenes OXCC13]MCZ4061862.1 hypothetical protein [Oxalobacter formigenes]QDX32695.1 hypothetical protein FPZ51_03375 [Oxalobacter formigenes]WAW01139.1 hypothetical protein NB644_09335 [Oxalobacter formigenes]
MKFDEFFSLAKNLNISSFGSLEYENRESSLLSNEVLFHLPFIAMVILIISTAKSKPRYTEIGQLVGECLERTLVGFKGKSQYLGWSANLRIRTVRALTFLEAAELIDIDDISKIISSTKKGKKVLNAAKRDTNNLSLTLMMVQRNYRNIRTEKQIELGI